MKLWMPVDKKFPHANDKPSFIWVIVCAVFSLTAIGVTFGGLFLPLLVIGVFTLVLSDSKKTKWIGAGVLFGPALIAICVLFWPLLQKFFPATFGY